MQSRFIYQSSGRGTPFHFQHGLGSNLNQPQNLLSDLQGVQLISMDCPGHGNAPLSEDITPSFDYYADQVIALMNELGIKKAIFGGISMGAGISINIALRFPEKVKALVLIRPAWLDQKSPENITILSGITKWIGKENGQAMFEKNEVFQQIRSVLPNAANSILGVFSSSQRKEIPLVLESMVNDRPFSDLAALKQIRKPSLIIGNEDDPIHPFTMAEIIHRHIEGSQLEKVVSRYLDDALHRTQINQIVAKFITNL